MAATPTRLRWTFVVAVVGALLTVVLPAASAAGAAAPRVRAIVSGLDSPRGLAIADGGILVAEAGRGGSGPCGPGPVGRSCVGSSGALTQVNGGVAAHIASGLPSVALKDGSFAIGPHDVAAASDGTTYATIGLAGSPDDRAQWGRSGRLLAHLVRTNGSGGVRDVADILAYEEKHNPDGGRIESDPYGLLRARHASIITDAAGNSLLKVTDSGHISTLAVFPNRTVKFQGSKVPIEAVPTSVVRGPDGALYVGQLTGFPFKRGAARVWRIVPGHRPQVYARGFTNIIDIAFDRRGGLYVLEIAHNSLHASSPYGALLRVRRSGRVTTVLDHGLTFPTSVAVQDDGSLLVTNCGVCPGGGQILKVRP
jgi:hypothetical protein